MSTDFRPTGEPGLARAHEPRRPGDLLVVTYHFPPIQSAGVYRMVGLVKYLHALGWRITVLTVRRSAHEGGDDASLALIPDGVTVLRTESPEPAAWVRGRVTRPRSGSRDASAVSPSSTAPPRRTLMRRFLARPGRWLVDALAYPDYQIGWVPRVAHDVVAFVKQHPHAVVLSSTPPHSTHLGVRIARAWARFVWVTDFRDPWTAPLRQPKGHANLAFQRALERSVLGSCDHVIANTEGNRTRLLGAFPRLDPRRVSVVTNAFDTSTMPDPASADDLALACDIAYFGEIYGGMLDRYLATVRVLAARDARRAPRLHVFGRFSDRDAHRVNEAGLENHIVFMGQVSYEKSLALMRAARSLLLLLPDGDAMATCVPSKLYPYLFAGRPVLAIVPPGDAARVVQEFGVGDVVAPGDVAANADRVAAFIERVRRGETVAEAARLRATQEYSMQRIALRVHDILREVQRG